MSDEYDNSGFGSSSFQTMGILNALKTGDVYFDMCIAMLIPILMKFVFDAIGKATDTFNLNDIVQFFFGQDSSQKHERILTYRTRKDSYNSTNLDGDNRNEVLIKAIQLYIHSELKLDLNSANIELTTMEEEKKRPYYYYSDDDDASKSLAGRLSKYKVIRKPPTNKWHKLGRFGKSNEFVELRIENHEEQIKEGDINATIILKFISADKDSIDSFIDKAYSWYIEGLRKMEDDSRYLYEYKSSSKENDEVSDDGDGSPCKRFQLSDEKTFESLFFKEKNSLLRLIDNFQNRKGKYSIKGYPHKLGVLLHGPPGTGKTSLIKALAEHTGRSIVNVPISKISTNAELMSVFFDQKYNVQGEDVPVKLGFKDVIFVMEDVDAASKVVHRRDGKMTSTVKETEHIDLASPKSLWQMLLESNEENTREVVSLLKKKSEKLKKAAQDPKILQSIAQRMTVLPGLGFVGNKTQEGTFDLISEEAVQNAEQLMNSYEVVDRFVARHAQTIRVHIDGGAEIDDAFINQLLSNQIPEEVEEDPHGFQSIPKAAATLSRDISYSKYNKNDTPHFEDNTNRILTDKPNAVGATPGPSLWKPKKDQLNLMGLLNVLDGVVDTPGRIVIMTTNHPEMLDPALIRPGRIDKKIFLGYMEASNVIEMLEHYFQTSLTPAQKERVTDAICGNIEVEQPRLDLTPAQVEQMAAEYEELEDILSALEEKGHSLTPKDRRGVTLSKGAIKYDV